MTNRPRPVDGIGTLACAAATLNNAFTAVYVRVSTRDQRHDSQLRELQRLCRLRGWKKLATYRETESGAKASRPQLDKLMKDMRAGKIARLVAYKLDRLGRSLHPSGVDVG